jgi:hypothetical protein
MRMQGRGDYAKRDDYDRQFHSSGGSEAYIGKPATAFSAGALTAPNNVVNLWSGDWGSKAATGKTKEVAASLGDFATTEFVIVSKLDGDWVVSCAPDGVS